MAAHLAILLSVLVSASVIDACPSAIGMQELSPRLTGIRAGTRLFALNSAAANSWRELPLQMDPVTEDGRLVFFDNETTWLAEPLDKLDFVSFGSESFGRRLKVHQDRLPCRGPVTYEIKDPGKSQARFAYLTNCGIGAGTDRLYPILFDKEHHHLQSDLYSYDFNPDNYMQFENIRFADGRGGWDLVARDSKLLIRADIKDFFNMNFDSDDIESQLETSRIGPVGDLARLSFYLKILFFKIRMSLSTDVGFYRDSSHIPMMVNIPVDARRHLYPGSGILYSWILAPSAAAGEKRIIMPPLAVSEVKKGHENLARIGLNSCHGLACYYEYSVRIGARRLSMDFNIDRRIVENGFFPLYVDDVARFKKAMGWKLDLAPGERRIGMYFEVSGLPEGAYPWDFWLRLGELGNTSEVCPHPIQFTKIPGGVLH